MHEVRLWTKTLALTDDEKSTLELEILTYFVSNGAAEVPLTQLVKHMRTKYKNFPTVPGDTTRLLTFLGFKSKPGTRRQTMIYM